MNIVLIGFMGTGKTVVSKLLADKLAWTQVDTDELIVLKTNKTISRIFEEDGEVFFRQIESEVLADLSSGTNQIVSTGGGIILTAENRKLLKQLGKVVLLTASPQTIIERLSDDTSRPLLQGTKAEKLEKIEILLEARNPLYTACADLVIDTSEFSPEEITETIIAKTLPTPN